MSIFASLAAPSSDEHEDECAFYVEREPGTLDISGKPCDCGQPNAPIIYQGSGVLPSENDPRGGFVDIALIPAHVRYWRDNPDAPVETEPEGAEPFLRFGVNEGTVILTRHNVEEVYATLGEWLETTKEGV